MTSDLIEGLDEEAEKPKRGRRQTGPTQAEREAMAQQTADEQRAKLEADGSYVSPLPDEPPAANVDAQTSVIDDSGYLAALEAASDTFGDDMTPESKAELDKQIEAIKEEITKPPEQRIRPPQSAMLQLSGNNYLPARMRIVWMRNQAESKGWSIQSTLIEHERGTFSGASRQRVTVKGGFAMFKAFVLDERGRPIGEGHAVEWSDNFGDYVEKAETSAIARALAVAGFGTESAMDLDEGWIADSPIGRDGLIARLRGDENAGPQTPAQINITASDVTGVQQGGRQTRATSAQLSAIRDASRTLDLTPEALAAFVVSTTGSGPTFDSEDEPAEQAKVLLDYIGSLSFDDCGKVVRGLMEAVNAANGAP